MAPVVPQAQAFSSDWLAGYARIAKALNAKRAPSPRPQRNHPSGWSPSSVKEILDRPLYHGEIVWNRSRRRNQWGQQQQQPRASDEWLTVPAPALRIVEDAAWQAAQDRRASLRRQFDQTTGRRVRSHGSRESGHLLTGFARCAVCGGALTVTTRSHGKNTERMRCYSCLAYHKRGTVICGNNLALPVDRVDDAVLSAIGDDVLRPAVVQAVIDGVLDAFAPAAVSEQLEELRTEAAALDRELARLTDAIARGGNLDTLLAALQTRQARRGELATMMAVGEAVDVERFDRKAIEARVRDRVKGWRELLTKRVEDGRRLLREALASPLRFTPEGRFVPIRG